MLRIMTIFLILCSFTGTGVAQESQRSDRKQPIGSIIVFRGDDVSIYRGGKKSNLAEKKMPYSLYPGDEIGSGASSDCEILLETDDTIYVSPDSLIGLDLFGVNSSKLSLRYGIVMFRGESAVELLAKDFSGYSSGGDFIFKYKRSSFETTVYNLGKDMKVKRDMDINYLLLKSNNFARLSSFKDGREFGVIKQESLSTMYNTFKISFKPGGKISEPGSIPGSLKEMRPLPYTRSVNLDTIKRVIGL